MKKHLSHQVTSSDPTSRLLRLLSFWLGSLACALTGYVTAEYSGGLAIACAIGSLCALSILREQRLPSLFSILPISAGIALLQFCGDATVPTLSAPKDLSGVFALSPFATSLSAMLLLGAELISQATRHRPLRVVELLSLISPPFFLGWLLLLSSTYLYTSVTPPTFASAFMTWLSVSATPIALRAAVLIVANALVAALIFGLTSKRIVWDRRLLGLLLVSAIFAGATPEIADLGAYLSVGMPLFVQAILVIAAVAIAQSGLWAQTYLITGLFLQAVRGIAPTGAWGELHYRQGLWRGAMYSIVFMSGVQVVYLFASLPNLELLFQYAMIPAGLVLGVILFPVLKTVVESFDGSAPFLHRLKLSFNDRTSYWRGALVGAAVGILFSSDIPNADSWSRFGWGALIGALAFGGINLLQDASEIIKNKRQSLQIWNVYAVQALLGSIAGGAVCWYADTRQLETIIAKFLRYATATVAKPEEYVIYPLFSKFGATDLGMISGGARLLYSESLSGVINWSLAAPLFSINLVLLSSLLYRRVRPLQEMFTTNGLVEVIEQTLRVERWGLWMAPIIYSFLRMTPEPSWYNQDGAVRTLFATFQSLALDPDGFNAWSLGLFVSMLTFDWLRVLIWFDHMGLRVATLVNLSFVGGDLVDEKASTAMGHPTPTRVIPEGLRRFGTWMPLLLPFYIPRGAEWDYAWGTAEAVGKSAAANLLPTSLWLAGFVAIAGTATVLARLIPWPQNWNILYSWTEKVWTLSNGRYTLQLDRSGRGWSRVTRQPGPSEEIDLTRRPVDPASLIGKFFYFIEQPADAPAAIWSLHDRPSPQPDAEYHAERRLDGSIAYRCSARGIVATATVTLDPKLPLERWKLSLKNTSQQPRTIRTVSYRDLVVQAGHAVPRQTGYNDLHLEMGYIATYQALLASNRLLKAWDGRPSGETFLHAVGPLPKQATLLGYEDSRLAFFGLGTEWKPLGLAEEPRPVSDEGLLFPFDPAASLWVSVDLAPGESVEFEFIEGFAENRFVACETIAKLFGQSKDVYPIVDAAWAKERRLGTKFHPATDAPMPWSFSEDGTEVHVSHTLPRAWAHPVANAGGYGFVATNEAAIFSFASNAQQNAVTPFILGHPSGVIPGQALYLWDVEQKEPILRMPRRLETDFDTANEVWDTCFGRGYVTYTVTKPALDVSLTAFVFPDQPLEARLLTLTNTQSESLSLRIGSFTQVILSEIAADSRGELNARWDAELKAFVIENPRQHFRRGPFFLAASFVPDSVETIRSNFVGPEHNMREPEMVRTGKPSLSSRDDGSRAAALTHTLTLEPGETVRLSLLFGQAESEEQIRPWIAQYNSPDALSAELERAKEYWREVLSVLRVETEDPAFDRMVNDWLPYQVLASRLWGRTGQHQRSGAFGFRDQLQDVIPLASIHPEISRKQILLHASQQFREGDALQWWHQTWRGETGLGARNRASDIPLWLPHVLLRYLRATGDYAVLEESVPFLEGQEIPASAEGICFIPRQAQESATVYQHALLAIDRGLSQLGARGIPLMGSCDWNDGLDSVGRHGRGESVWLGFFLHSVLVEFAPTIERFDGAEAAKGYLDAAAQLREALEPMWRDGRYVRATMDDGQELIYDDALTTAWPIISQAVGEARGGRAMEHGLAELEKEHMVLLLAPPFGTHSNPYPGRIAIYPPGVRENGGQYSHGSSWLVDALMVLSAQARSRGDLDGSLYWRSRAARVWKKISPLSHAGAEQWAWYGLAPHQQPADVYAGSGHHGCGGWSWYTGSAGRMLTAAWELLGVRVENGEAKVAAWATDRTTWPRLKRVQFQGEDVPRQAEE